jgi:uncharacterized protein (DUF1330 family)
MAAYMIVILKNHSTEWLAEYVAAVPPMFRSHGGEYLGVSNNIKQLEGPDFGADTVALFTFPTLAAVTAFMESDDYKPFADLRKQHSEAMVFGIETAG